LIDGTIEFGPLPVPLDNAGHMAPFYHYLDWGIPHFLDIPPSPHETKSH
jgi:hypothetical protein